MSTKKRRQHHVWQHYLRSWATDGYIWCLRDKTIFRPNTLNVAVERDFYKLRPISAHEKQIIETVIIKPAHPVAQEHHKTLLNNLMKPVFFFEQLQAHMSAVDFEPELDKYLTNIIEDYHTGIEIEFIPILERLLKSDSAFYSEENTSILFFHFLSMQHMRTKNIKERTCQLLLRYHQIDFSGIWNVVVLMLAFNIGMSLFGDRHSRRLSILTNKTQTPFITGDQPTINLVADGTRPPDELRLYYPLSPTLALLLTEPHAEPAFSDGQLSEDNVSYLNGRIKDASRDQIFGVSEQSLLPYSKT